MTITNYVMLITKNRPHSLFPLWIHLILLLWWTKPTSTATTRMHAGNWKVETKRPSSIVTRARNTLNYRSPSNVGYSRVNFQDYRSTGYSRTYLCPTRRAKYLNYFIVSLLLATRNMADSSRLLYAEVKCTFAVFFLGRKGTVDTSPAAVAVVMKRATQIRQVPPVAVVVNQVIPIL